MGSLSVSQGYGMKSNPERHQDRLEIGLFKRETPGLTDHSIAIILNFFLKMRKKEKCREHSPTKDYTLLTIRTQLLEK